MLLCMNFNTQLFIYFLYYYLSTRFEITLQNTKDVPNERREN